MTNKRSRIFLNVALPLAALIATVYWWQRGQPVVLPDAPSDRVACVSYAPYHHPGQTPFAAGTVIPPDQIEQDLRRLAKLTNCVRTYSVGQGLAAVPAIAHRLGMKVLLGIWLGRDRQANEHELILGIQTARANRDAVRAVVVGNEVMLRGELPASQLATDIEKVHAETGLPVTYADVWEYWLKYPQLAQAVSFITIHILPYWENHPVAVADAVTHVQAVYKNLQTAFPDKTIFIGETGWPSAGRQRGGAIPDLVNEARFVRGFLRYATTAAVSYNLVEAYDQPWKRWLEGTAGGHWGLYNAAGRQKFPLRGPVVEDPQWIFGPLAGIAFALLLCLIAVRRTPRADFRYLGGLALAAYLTGSIITAQIEQLLLGNRDQLEWLLGGSWTLIELVTALLFAQYCGRLLQPDEPPPFPGRIANPALRWIGLQHGTSTVELLRFVWLFGAAVVCLLLMFDPRYRGFPVALFLPAACWFVIRAVTERPGVHRISLENRLLAAWVGIGAVLIACMQGWANTSALAWCTLCVALSLSVWLPYLRSRQHQNAEYQSDRTGFEAIPHQTGSADHGG